MDVPNPPLEPLSTLFILATVPYCGLKPKIGIVDGRLVVTAFDQSINGYYQSLVRRYNNMSRDDVAQLFEVIMQLQYWYTVDGCWCNESSMFIKLIGYSIEGLKILQNTYREGAIVFCIQHLINLMEMIKSKKQFDPATMYTHCFNRWLERDKVVNHDKIISIWDQEEVEGLINILDQCQQVNHETGLSLADRQEIICSKIVTVEQVIQKHHQTFRGLVAFKKV